LREHAVGAGNHGSAAVTPTWSSSEAMRVPPDTSVHNLSRFMANGVIERYKRDDAEFDRAVAFIDATFAVALTLLVTTLDLGSEPKSWDSLSSFYDGLGSQLVAFAISFLVIAGYWLSHYRLMATFSAIDIPVIVVNLVLLAAIVILPFSTESAGNPDINDLPLPTVMLAVNIAAVSTAFTLLYVLARRRGLLRKDPAPREFTWSALSFLTPAVVFLVSVPIAVLATPGLAQLSWLSLLVVNPIVGAGGKRSTQASS
jgi:uncharacterized membrane protein